MKLMRQALAAMLLVGVASLMSAAPRPLKTESETDNEALQWNSPYGEAPSVVWQSPNNNFTFGLGGTVKVTGNFDFGDVISSPDAFVTSEIPTGAAKGNGAQWNGSAAQTELHLNGVLMPGTKNQVGLYVEFNFMGNNYTPELQLAYVQWRCLKAGYAYSLFSDTEAIFPTIDFQGPNAWSGIQNAVVHVSGNLTKSGSISGGIGVDASMASYDANTGTEVVTQRLPDIPAYLQYNMPSLGGHVRFGAMLRNLYYRNTVADKNIDRVGWGVQLSGLSNLGVNSPVTVFWQGTYGHGISSYYQDLIGADLDLVGNGDGSMKALKSWGALLGLQWNINSKWQLSGGYSQIRLLPGDVAGMPEGSYKYAQYATGTLMYNITSWLQGGVEYIYGLRKQFDGLSYHDNRVMVGLQASF